MFHAKLDSWVYILFGILWIAFAIYKGQKKNTKTVKTVKETKPPASSNIENIVDSILSGEVTEEAISENIARDGTETTPVHQENTVEFQEEVHSVPVKEKPPKPLTQPKVRKINIKKAIIYSEILRRPYE